MKQKINKILVALDGSERSFKGLKEAIYLARQCGATITGLCVTPFYTINLGPLLTSLKNQTLKELNNSWLMQKNSVRKMV